MYVPTTPHTPLDTGSAVSEVLPDAPITLFRSVETLAHTGKQLSLAGSCITPNPDALTPPLSLSQHAMVEGGLGRIVLQLEMGVWQDWGWSDGVRARG